MATDIQSVEQLAADLERRVHVLENSPGTSGAPAQHSSTTTPSNTDLLKELRDLRTTLAAALEEAKQTESLNALLKEETEALKKDNSKKEYRINILVQSVRELQGKAAS